MPLPRSASRNARAIVRGQLDQAGVEQGRVLALQQADAAEPVRQRDRDVGAFLARGSRPRRSSQRRVERREDRGDRDRADARARGSRRAAARMPVVVERHDRRGRRNRGRPRA